MKRIVFGLVILAAIAAVVVAQSPSTNSSGERAALLSPLQPVDRGVLSTIPSGRRDFRRDPPQVADVSAESLGGGKVKLFVRFDERGLPAVLTLTLEQERVALRDDGQGGDVKAGDGIYTVVSTLPQQFLDDRQTVAKRMVDVKGGKVFRNRRLVDVRVPVAAQNNRFAILPPLDFLPFFVPPVDPARSLMIVDTGVVRDPTRAGNPCMAGSNALGPWSFGSLMTEMANQGATGVTPSNFVRNWLNQWTVPQPINGPPVPARTQIVNKVINPWLAASGGGPNLDMKKAPLRLLAIVNRIDLHDNAAYGAASGGELRFVFGVMNNCQPTPFAVILEYGVPPMSCPALKAYAQKWQALTGMTPGTPAFNAALQAITDPITKHGAMPTKPNGSAINQVRTNEISLAGPWELREFRVDGSHLLRETTTKQTPIGTFNDTLTFTNEANAHAAAILNHTYVVPMSLLPGPVPYLSGNATVPSAVGKPTFWRGNPAIANNDVRSFASLNTCNGCHSGETATPFVHVNPSSPIAAPAALSGFLTGETIADPVVPATPRTYHDLQDRKQKLQALLTSPCLIHGLFDQPLRMVH
jgi:hypothetical protein